MADMLKSVSAPLLVVHDRDDRAIPFAHALQLREAARGPAELLATSGLGHRRVLRDRDVVNKVVEFIDGTSSRLDAETERGAA